MSILTHKNTNVRGRKVATVLLAGALAVGTWCGLTANAAYEPTLNDGTLTFDVSSDAYPEASGRVKTLATFTTALATTPTLEMVATDGTPVNASRWYLLLLDNGKTLKFGVSSGTTLLLR